MYDFFISHTKTNYNTELLCILLKTALECKKYNVFFDIEDLIIPSGNIKSCLKNKIKNSKIFIIIIDENTFNSNYVKLEIKYAILYKIPIVPIIDSSIQNFRKTIISLKKNIKKKSILEKIFNYKILNFNIYYRRCFIKKLENHCKKNI